jgi:hypothetical protein
VDIYIQGIFSAKVTFATGIQLPDEESVVTAFEGKGIPLLGATRVQDMGVLKVGLVKNGRNEVGMIVT